MGRLVARLSGTRVLAVARRGLMARAARPLGGRHLAVLLMAALWLAETLFPPAVLVLSLTPRTDAAEAPARHP